MSKPQLVRDALKYFKPKDRAQIQIALLYMALREKLKIEELRWINEWAPEFQAAFCKFTGVGQVFFTESVIRGEVFSVTFLQEIIRMREARYYLRGNE